MVWALENSKPPQLHTSNKATPANASQIGSCIKIHELMGAMLIQTSTSCQAYRIIPGFLDVLFVFESRP